MTQRPFRFGVVAGTVTTRRELIDTARRAEQLGFSTLHLPDHLTTELSPTVALMAAADATTTLRVGSWVFCNDYRHPALLAKEVATLDVLSEGRVEFGLGAGWQQSEYEQAGMTYDAHGIRISRFEETVQIVKGLFASEPFSFSGKYYTIKDLNGQPKPVQHPHPPMYIGGGGKRVLSIAARQANIVGILPIARTDESYQNMTDGMAEATQRKVTWIREAAGSRIDELELHTGMFVVIPTDNRNLVTQKMAGRFGIAQEEVQQLTHILVGTVDQMCEDLMTRRDRYGISYVSVLLKDMEAFAPVVERLAHH